MVELKMDQIETSCGESVIHGDGTVLPLSIDEHRPSLQGLDTSAQLPSHAQNSLRPMDLPDKAKIDNATMDFLEDPEELSDASSLYLPVYDDELDLEAPQGPVVMEETKEATISAPISDAPQGPVYDDDVLDENWDSLFTWLYQGSTPEEVSEPADFSLPNLGFARHHNISAPVENVSALEGSSAKAVGVYSGDYSEFPFIGGPFNSQVPDDAAPYECLSPYPPNFGSEDFSDAALLETPPSPKVV